MKLFRFTSREHNIAKDTKEKNHHIYSEKKIGRNNVRPLPEKLKN